MWGKVRAHCWDTHKKRLQMDFRHFNIFDFCKASKCRPDFYQLQIWAKQLLISDLKQRFSVLFSITATLVGPAVAEQSVWGLWWQLRPREAFTAKNVHGRKEVKENHSKVLLLEWPHKWRKCLRLEVSLFFSQWQLCNYFLYLLWNMWVHLFSLGCMCLKVWRFW